MGVVDIEILGRRYSLQSDRPPEHLQRVAAHVDKRLREVTGGRTVAVQRDHAILAALNIASELFIANEQRRSFALGLDGKLQGLDARVQLAADQTAGALGGPPTHDFDG